MSKYLEHFWKTKYIWNITRRQWWGMFNVAPPGYGRYEEPGPELIEYMNSWMQQVGSDINEMQRYVVPGDK